MSTAGKIFSDRAEAGRRLGERLAQRHVDGQVVVLGLPRGGVPVACEVAKALGATVDVLVVRKLGVPFNPELAAGSIASGGITVFNDRVLDMLRLDQTDLDPIIEREQQELERRERAYRGSRPPPDLRDKTVVLVDDGAATGATMRAGVEAVRTQRPRRIIVALPTGSREAVARLDAVADDVVVLSTPADYRSVGSWYLHFEQLSDSDVLDWLRRHDDTGGSAKSVSGR